MVVADLLGPVGGPEEEILTSIDKVVRDRYLLGVLAPSGTVAIDPERADSAEVEGNTSPDIPTDDEPMPDAAAAKAAMFPSSIGMSFVLEERATTIRVESNWGHYEKEVTSEDGAAATEEGAPLQASPGSASARSGGRRIWKRYPIGGVAPVELFEGSVGPSPSHPKCLKSCSAAGSPSAMVTGCAPRSSSTSKKGRITTATNAGCSNLSWRVTSPTPDTRVGRRTS